MRPRLRKVLTDPPRKPGQRCRVCALPALQRDLMEWVELRAAGGAVCLTYFHHHYLSVVHSNCPSFGSVRGHLMRCARIDPVTGKPL